MSVATQDGRLVSAGVVRFLAHNLADILGRHQAKIPAQPKLELKMLLDAIGEIGAISSK